MIALVLAAGPVAAAAQSPPGAAWLDRPLASWNQPGSAVPRAPRSDAEAPTTARCRAQVRPPSIAADRAVTGGGWTLFGPAQLFGGTALVTAMSGVDGMCRPLGYQVFVFVDGRFAGTLSPAPMDSRTDGAATLVRLTAAADVYADFQRYAEQDPLCCPSRTSTVRFKVARSVRGPVVVPLDVHTPP